MIHRWLLLFATFAITGVIFGGAYAEDDVLIKRVKTTWRAQDGATVDDILSRVVKIAHFVPRGWEVGQKHDTETPVVFSWARSQGDKPDDAYTISWNISAKVTWPTLREGNATRLATLRVVPHCQRDGRPIPAA